ncbi:MAG: hypothetical protein JO092_01555 [Candidatus Eremiobacteraeota bacterium]|nr:hypothetical protein [Candidatus Eremiobacteraeota bacterium]
MLVAVLVASALAPADAADPLASLRYQVGTWTCTYHSGTKPMTYKASFSYALGNNWMRERDSWAGGGGDEDLFTYDPKTQSWTAVVVENERATVLFRARGANPNHIVYRSVYPDASATDVFDRVSPTRYTLHFSQTTGGKTTKSFDTCVKD